MDAATAAQLRGMMAASIDTDLSGLNVRRDGETTRFTYPGGVFVLVAT